MASGFGFSFGLRGLLVHVLTRLLSTVLLTSQVSGAIITPISILFMIYAIYLYNKRNRQLLSRSTLRYDDARGPWMLTILLICSTLIVTILALHTFRSEQLGNGSGHAHASGMKLVKP